ncbi:PAAR domain-containing protein [Oxalobacteraceae bacterium OM1]|nr:PAAR domain-containing protein [Oxalobacteraceae bacterium OM1]
MQGRRVIRLGDPTTHGGTVVSGADNYTMDDTPVARMGDYCTCPVHGHSGCVIVEGDPAWTIGGRPVALEGHLTSCGAALISTFGRLLRETEADASIAVTAGSSTRSSRESSSTVPAVKHGVRFQGMDKQTGQVLADWAYIVVREDGSIEGGTTDAEGFTHAIEAEEPEQVAVHFVFRSPGKDLGRELFE